MRFRSVWLLLAVVLATSGCAGAGVVSVAQLPTILASIDDVPGDALANTTPGSGTAYDILKVEARRIDTPPFGSYDTLRVDIQFAQEPLLPPPGSFASLGTQLVFRIYFDTDQNAATGAWRNGMCLNPPPGGSEFIVNATNTNDTLTPVAPQPRIAPSGNYEVVSGTQKTGEASVNIDGNTLQVTVPLSVLGNPGPTNISVRVGNAVDVATDCAPEAAGFITTGQGATR